VSFPYLLPLVMPGGLGSGPADRITNHAEAALDRLAEQFKGKTNLAYVLNPLNVQTQALEDGAWGVLSTQALSAATSAGLDVYGRIVGQPRGSLDDTGYRLAIAARIRVNRSSGTAEDLYGVLGLVIGEGVTMEIVDYPPAAFEMHLFGAAVDVDSAAVFLDLLRQTRAAGVNGQLAWSNSEPGDTVTLDSGPGLDVGHLADVGL
jgi:hypothetical protein